MLSVSSISVNSNFTKNSFKSNAEKISLHSKSASDSVSFGNAATPRVVLEGIKFPNEKAEEAFLKVFEGCKGLVLKFTKSTGSKFGEGYMLPREISYDVAGRMFKYSKEAEKASSAQEELSSDFMKYPFKVLGFGDTYGLFKKA